LGEVAEVVSGQSPPGESYNEAGDGVPFYQGKTEFGRMFIGAPTKWTTDPQKFAETEDILMSVRAPVGPVNLATQRVCIGRGLSAIEPNASKLIALYAFYFLRSQEINIKGDLGAAFASINREDIQAIQIPLPPLSVQKEIVAEIEGYQKVIDGARAVVENYCPHVSIDPAWPMVELGEAFHRSEKSVLPGSLSGSVTYIGLENISQGTGEIAGNTVAENPADIKSLKNVFQRGDILYGKLRPNLNKVWLADRDGICSTDILVIQPLSDQVIPAFYTSILRSESFNERVMSQVKGAQLPRVGWSSFANITIPLPPLDVQRRVVAEIEEEQTLVNATKELIERFEEKIQGVIARVWGVPAENAGAPEAEPV
jgi:restriction endonuclease S subunit